MEQINVEIVFKHPVKRRDLPKILGCDSDREARRIIAELEKEYNIVNMQDGRGYFLADDKTAIKVALRERKRGIALIKKANEILSRCESVPIDIVVPVKAHFRRIKKSYVDKKQIELF